MRATTRAHFVAEMVGWLNRKFAPAGTVIRSDTPLFVGGLINSIRILELIAWTERATGRPIPDADIRMDHFHCVDRIADVFMREDTRVVA
jgi:hypothetical protein